MEKGRYETFHKRRSSLNKALAVVLSLMLVSGCVAVGTLAWLIADSGPVQNTFSTSNISIKLDEGKVKEDGLTVDKTDRVTIVQDFKMIPGWTIEKDPLVTVEANSEDCWLFVKVVKSGNCDNYLAYKLPETGENKEWQNVAGDSNTIILARKVTKSGNAQKFKLLLEGSYTDPMGTDDASDNVTVDWADNQLAVKPSVTEEMMTAAATNKPSLTFTAYAVQLYKTSGEEFGKEEAWALAQAN